MSVAYLPRVYLRLFEASEGAAESFKFAGFAGGEAKPPIALPQVTADIGDGNDQGGGDRKGKALFDATVKNIAPLRSK